MAVFSNAVITAKGQALIAKALAEEALISFSKVATSDTDNSEEDLASLESIGTIKQYTTPASIIRQNESNVKVHASFTNEALSTGYYVRTIGLYAIDPDDGEILYSVVIADETTVTADFMPPYNGVGVSTLLLDLITAVSNADRVDVTVDPTGLATVEMLEDLQQEVDAIADIVGYFPDQDGVFGVEVDFANNTFTRLAGAVGLSAGADFSAYAPWGGRRRCNVADNGRVNAYYGQAGYIEDGSNGQVMVEQPVFYVKTVPLLTQPATSGEGVELVKAQYYISLQPRTGFSVPHGFRNDLGYVEDKIYLSAYEGCIYDVSASAYITNDSQVMDANNDKFSSIAGAKPASGVTQDLTRANVRKMCNNRGTGWRSHDVFALGITEYLYLVENASFDCQRKTGRGVCDLASGSGNEALNTGGTATLGNGSGNAPGGTDGQCSVSYRGEENLWGNIWTWLDKLNVNANSLNEAYLCRPGSTVADDVTTGYDKYPARLGHENGYQSRLGYSEDYPDLFLPTAAAGDDSKPVGSYYYQNYTASSFFIALLGGFWNNGSSCGWYLYVYSTSSNRHRTLGGRLLYVPQTVSA